MNSILFEKKIIKNIELKNRFMMSAVGDHHATGEGHITDGQIETFSEIAAGGVALIVLGAVYVHQTGKFIETQVSIADDGCIGGLRKFAKAIHNNGAKAVVQLFHGGRLCAKYQKENGGAALAPSIISDDEHFENKFYTEKYKEATEEEIMEIISSFGDAARRAKDAGFDAVQLHGAHDYLFSQFLSPYTNKRKDRWGGSLENRIRLHHETYKDIRKKAGEDYPVMIKMGVQDGFNDALIIDEGKLAARLLSEWGFDVIEVSQGLRGKWFEETEMRTKINSVEKEGYFRPWAREVKKEVKTPTVMQGGLRTFELVEEIIKNKEADFIGLCRPLLREPNLVNDWEKGDTRTSRCISCNRCVMEILKGNALGCYLDNKEIK